VKALPHLGFLAWKSLLNRMDTAALTVFALAVSVALLLGVEKIRTEAKASFASTISGTDLIVGARSGPIPLLLYSVFRIGNATSNISWESYLALAARPEVEWTIPLSLGDSHRGFRVLGSTAEYFKRYRYRADVALAFAAGKPFDDLFDAVLGADVAETLGYRLGQSVVVDHGLGAEGFTRHQDKPFRVSGILKRTGTPVDRTVHVSLEAIEAIHIDWQSGSRVPGMSLSADDVRRMQLRPKSITAVMVGLKSRLSAFGFQRQVNEYRAEPLLAILPGVALQELWQLLGVAEMALSAISVLVVAAGLLGMLTMLLASLNERRREMAILRSAGARPLQIFAMFQIEATILTLLGAGFGLTLLYLLLLLAKPVVQAEFGLNLGIGPPSSRDLAVLAFVVVAGGASGAIPAYRAYRRTVADGLIMRV
jgi:putative ABC transport system permease protein